MNKADLKRNLEAELLKIERQNRSWSTGETRYDRMIEDVLIYIDNSISKEVIEQEIEKYKLLELESFNRDSIQADEYRAIIKVLQELLEGK